MPLAGSKPVPTSTVVNVPRKVPSGELTRFTRLNASIERSSVPIPQSSTLTENSKITLDRYGHLMPGTEVEAAELLDAYLERTAG
jgi:hypothetical protein